MKKIMILGNGGSGKSYLAKRLAKIIGYPLTHLDSIYWKNRWQHTPIEEWEAALYACLQQESCIMEGTPIRDLSLRLSYADTIIFLDIPRHLCIWRILKKGLLQIWRKNYHRNSDGCPVKGISLKTIRWIWSYPSKVKPKILSLIFANQDKKNIFYFKNKNEVVGFLNKLMINKPAQLR